METHRKKRPYLVSVPEVHVSTIRVLASDKNEAFQKVLRHGLDAGDEISLEYSHKLEPSTWSVELEKAPHVGISCLKQPESEVYKDAQDIPVESISAIVAYDYEAEEKNYRENPAENHIFLHLQRVQLWLEHISMKDT